MSRGKAYQIIEINSQSSQDSLPDDFDKSLLHKIGLVHPCFHSKTDFCKHDFGCIENTLKDASRSFAYGYSIRLLISLIGLLLKGKPSGLTIKRIWDCIVSSGNVKFGAFLGLMALIMKGLICTLRKVRGKEDWRNSFVSGALAGYFSLFFIKNKTRVVFATFFLSRAFVSLFLRFDNHKIKDCYYNSLVKRKVIKDSKLNHVIIFMLLNALTVYARFHEPYLVPPSLSKFYEFVYSKGPMEAQLEHVLLEMTRRRLVRDNIIG